MPVGMSFILCLQSVLQKWRQVSSTFYIGFLVRLLKIKKIIDNYYHLC